MKTFKNLILSTCCLLGMLLMDLYTVYASEPSISYIHKGGKDRYETSAKLIYTTNHTKSDYAVLVSGENYPDALSAAPLAKRYNAPIILINKDSSIDWMDGGHLLQSYGVKYAFIIGGSGVLPTSIENSLKLMNIQPTRIGGQDRYETSIEVAKKLGNPEEAFVTSGENFRNALSVSTIAAKKIAPIILTPNNYLPDETKNFFNNHNISKTYVIGGKNIIDDNIANSLPNTERISAADDYSTNAAVINKFSSDFDFSETYIASGEDFADGLSGSAVAAQTSSPIILVKDPVPASIKQLIDSKRSQIKHVTVLGGKGSVSNLIMDQLGGFQEEQYIEDILKPITLDDTAYNSRFDYFRINNKIYNGFDMDAAYCNQAGFMYTLDGKYKSVSGKLGIDDYYSPSSNTTVPDGTSCINIYGDGKLLKSVSIKTFEDPVDFNVDVTGVSQLKFVHDKETPSDPSTPAYLYDLDFINVTLK